jgi:hypothetical protein
MPTIIRDRTAVRGSSLEDLNHTYRELKGQPDFPGFTNRSAAEVQVHMAIMAAEDAAGHAGVPAGTKPVAKTPAELGHNPYREGSLSHRLHAEISGQQPIAARPKAADKPAEERAQRVVIRCVRATFAGTSKPQSASLRNQVLLHIQAAPEHTCTVEALEGHFRVPVRGHLQKLIEKGHLALVEEAAA